MILSIHQDIKERLNRFILDKNVPNLIFHGPSGSGKRTLLNEFLGNVYDNDKKVLSQYVMSVDCARGKGIKFIREQVKFFAKITLESKQNSPFKSVVLTNADKLTTDAQSALRRLIEVFSHSTRFFLIVEDKNNLLRPILSRLSEIYIPLPIINNKQSNLHQILLHNLSNDNEKSNIRRISSLVKKYTQTGTSLRNITSLSNACYQAGLSSLDVSTYFLATLKDPCFLQVLFDKIRSEYRCERLLLTTIFYIGLIRCEEDFHNIGFM